MMDSQVNWKVNLSQVSFENTGESFTSEELKGRWAAGEKWSKVEWRSIGIYCH